MLGAGAAAHRHGGAEPTVVKMLRISGGWPGRCAAHNACLDTQVQPSAPAGTNVHDQVRRWQRNIRLQPNEPGCRAAGLLLQPLCTPF